MSLLRLWPIIFGGFAWIAMGGMAPAVAQYLAAGGEFPSSVVPVMNGGASDFAPRRSGSAAGADLAISISSAGVYRITQPQLVAAGFASNLLVGDALRLFCRTQEVACQVSQSGVWATNDYLWFYGVGHSGYDSATNVYWLGLSGGTRLGLMEADGATNAGGVLVTTHWERVRYAPDLLWRDFYRPWDDTIDHWFAALVTHTADVSTTVAVDERIAAGSAYLQTLIYGLTSSSHTTRVSLNGTPVLSYAYTGAERFATSDVVAASLLVNGVNTFTWRQTNAPLDSVYLVEYTLDYARNLKARSNQLHYQVPAGTYRHRVSGLTTNAGFLVLDVTDPARPVGYSNWNVTGGPGNYELNVRTEAASPRRFYITPASQMGTSPRLQRHPFRDLAATNNQAEYLMITPYAFRRPAYDLLKHRQTNGMAVQVVPLEDLYNEFSYGIAEAAAIKQFIGYAYHHWAAPAPRFVCLVGDGTPDPRNGLGLNPAITVPVHYGPSSFNWCPQDNWYGCVDGTDWLVDLSIGRIPVASTTELARVVAKVKSFESTPASLEVLLTADQTDTNPPPLNFKTASETYLWPPLNAAGYFPSTAYYDDTPVPSLLRSAIAGGINSGVHLATYFGHGAADMWSAHNIWNTNDISALSNTYFPIVAIFSCKSGAFDDAARASAAEVFVRSQRGAVVCVAPTVLSVQTFAEKIAQGFMEEFTNQTTRIGDSLNAGLLNLWNWNSTAYELLCYQIFGDPALEKY